MPVTLYIALLCLSTYFVFSFPGWLNVISQWWINISVHLWSKEYSLFRPDTTFRGWPSLKHSSNDLSVLLTVKRFCYTGDVCQVNASAVKRVRLSGRVCNHYSSLGIIMLCHPDLCWECVVMPPSVLGICYATICAGNICVMPPSMLGICYATIHAGNN